VDLVHRCRAAGLKVAVASSADLIKIEANLRQIGLLPEQWDTIVCAEDVIHKKPAPDIFLAAARKLGLAPSQCVVVEDAVNGIQAAKAAQMRCVAVAQSFPSEQLTEADLIRARIADITLADLGIAQAPAAPPEEQPPGGSALPRSQGFPIPTLSAAPVETGPDRVEPPPRDPGSRPSAIDGPAVPPQTGTASHIPRSFLSPPVLPAPVAVSSGPPRPWGFWATSLLGLVIAVATLVAQVVAVLPLVLLFHQRSVPIRFDDSNGLLLSIASIAGLPVTTLFCFAFAKARRGMSARDYLGLRYVPAGQTLRWLVGLLLVIGAMDVLTWMLRRPIVLPDMIETYRTAGSVALLWLAIVLAAPVAEEIFFRGFLFAGFAASPLGAVGATLLTSFTWALFHVQYDLYGRVMIFIAGLLLGWARWRTRSVTVPILMHALMNAVATIETGIATDRLPDPPTPGTVLV
jgi:membrane protease YdiL (CAAX protease family)/predicted HAD superfamily phosphohydrolase YqeG